MDIQINWIPLKPFFMKDSNFNLQ